MNDNERVIKQNFSVCISFQDSDDNIVFTVKMIFDVGGKVFDGG